MPARLLGVTLVAVLFLSCGSAQAQRLPGGVRPEHYDLAFDVDLTNARFTGQATIAVHLSVPSNRITLNAADLVFQEAVVTADGVTQQATTSLNGPAETVTLGVPREIQQGPAEIRIRYQGVLGDQLRGFYLSSAGGRRYAVTQFESTDARRAFPAFDEPAYKATFALTLTIPDGATAISNGRVLSDTPGPAPGTHTLRFSRTAKMSSYLVAMAVGDFGCLEGASDKIPIRVCATADKKYMGSLALDATRQILSYVNRYFTIPYPFEKLDLVAVPDFAAGAMENTAAIFFREADLLSASASPPVDTEKRIWNVIAHEIAHQWFGDLVTMAWWDDLWLNEGFASWMEKRSVEALRPGWRMDLERVSDAQRVMVVDELASTRAIHTKVETPAEIEETFDTIAYEKGAAVVRMVEGFVGGQAFRAAVNAYLDRHAYGNATSADLWTIVSAVSRKPVDRILPTFVHQAGVPLVEVSLQCDGSRAEISMKTTRFFTGTPLTVSPRWQIPICVKTASTGPVTCRLADGPSATLPLDEPGCPAWAFVNAGGRGYFRTAYAPTLLSALSRDAGARLTAPERLMLVGDEWALVKAGRHSISDYLTLVSGFGEEPADAVLSEVAGRLDFVHAHLTTPASRPAFERFVQSLFRPIAARLGLREAEGEGDETRALRATVVSALGGAGNDTAIAGEASRLLAAALSGEKPLDASSADAIVALAPRRGDAALWERLVAASKAASDPAERYRYLYALARFDNATLLDRGLALALTPDVRSQDTGIYLNRFLSNPVARDRAWAFVKKNWATLRPKLTVSFGEARLVQGLTSFCDRTARDDIRRFFGANRLRYGSRTLERTLETMNGCIAMRPRGTTDVAAWLASR